MRKSHISIGLLAAYASIAHPQPMITQYKPAIPANDPGTWVSSADYPLQALRSLRQGTVRFRLIVGSDGAVTACEVTSSSGSLELDTATCNLLTQRARFVPDRTGLSAFRSRITWKIPVPPKLQKGEGRVLFMTLAQCLEETTASFSDQDVDRDGFLSMAETLAPLKRLKNEEREFNVAIARQKFKERDTNGDDKVSLEEAKQSVARGFAHADTNHDGQVSVAEWEANIKSKAPSVETLFF